MKQHSTQYWIIGSLAVVALLAGTAAAAVYFTRASMEPKQQEARYIERQPTAMAYQQQPAKKPCDDKNIVGTLGGAAVGGVIGNQFGHGKGKTAATVGGAVAGGVLGNQFAPTQNMTCP